LTPTAGEKYPAPPGAQCVESARFRVPPP
jgi:hypothetical protein